MGFSSIHNREMFVIQLKSHHEREHSLKQLTISQQLLLELSSCKKGKVPFSFPLGKAECSLGAAFLLKAEIIHEEFDGV